MSERVTEVNYMVDENVERKKRRRSIWEKHGLNTGWAVASRSDMASSLAVELDKISSRLNRD